VETFPLNRVSQEFNVATGYKIVGFWNLVAKRQTRYILKELSGNVSPRVDMTKIVIAVLANAGGVGKSTLAAHLGYEIAKKKVPVGLIDLDSNCTLDILAGLEPADIKNSSFQIFDEFRDWHLVSPPKWKMKNLTICQSHLGMADAEKILTIKRMPHNFLQAGIESYPIEDGVIILDCPASLGMICENAIAASTHIIIPVEMEVKSINGAVNLLEWSRVVIKDLKLSPSPQILGIVPSIYNSAKAQQRQYLDQLPELFTPLGVKIYPPIRDTVEFSNASGHGLPLHLYRPKHPAINEFRTLTRDIIKLTK
jgi:chromosome partitioning protein